MMQSTDSGAPSSPSAQSQPEANSDALLRTVALSLLTQGQSLLEKVIVSDETLCRTSKLVPGSSVGKHMRHLHDHFRLLLDAAGSTDKDLDYDSRHRNTPMETSRQSALYEFARLRRRIETEADAYERDMPLSLKATTPFPQEFDANFGRELWFACLHATHHYALIRVIVTGELGLELPQILVSPQVLWYTRNVQRSSDTVSPGGAPNVAIPYRRWTLPSWFLGTALSF